MLSPWLAYKRQEAGDPAVSIHVLKTTPGAKFTRVFCGMSTRWAFSFPSSGASWRQEDIGDETEQAGLGGAGEAGREVFGKGKENSLSSESGGWAGSASGLGWGMGFPELGGRGLPFQVCRLAPFSPLRCKWSMSLAQSLPLVLLCIPSSPLSQRSRGHPDGALLLPHLGCSLASRSASPGVGHPHAPQQPC